MSETPTTTDVALIGAGPIGLELAANLKDQGVDYLHFDAGTVGQTITWYPKRVQFFSSPDRIAICGVPLNTADQTKATREEYLAYLRGIVEQFDLPIRTYERVERIERNGDAFVLHTTSRDGRHEIAARRVIDALGDMQRPRASRVEGEDQPHVRHYFDAPHAYFGQNLLIVGGRNSAVEAAIRCHRAGAKVALSYRGETFPGAVKYWLKPEIEWLIKSGAVGFYPRTVPARIGRGEVELVRAGDGSSNARPQQWAGFSGAGDEPGGERVKVAADFVLLLVGYEMDSSLLASAGVQLHGPNRAPRIDHGTMQTNVPGLYVAGTAVAGTQVRFKLFIENAHPHVVKIMRAVTGHDPRHVNPLAFSRLHEAPMEERADAET